jgi:hypothetical protein
MKREYAQIAIIDRTKIFVEEAISGNTRAIPVY